MHIFLRHNSDRIALSTGSPNRISLGYSEDPRAVAGRLPRRGADEPKNVLLLGANGYVGMHMLRELLGDARVATVYALVRRKGDKSGEDRIARQLRKYKMELPDTGKLSVLEGSYLEPAMGLDPAAHHELLTEVDVVIDAAGRRPTTTPTPGTARRRSCRRSGSRSSACRSGSRRCTSSARSAARSTSSGATSTATASSTPATAG